MVILTGFCRTILRQRQAYKECSSFLFFSFKPYLAMPELNYLFGHSQPEACTRCLGSEVWLEYTGGYFFADAMPCICDRSYCVAIFFYQLYIYPPGFPPLKGLHGMFEHVDQHT